GEHVGGVVPDELERTRVLAGEKLDLRVALDRVVEIREHAVERHGDGALGERRRNAFGDVEAGRALRIFPTRAVGKGQRDHHSLLLITRCLRMQVSLAGQSGMPPPGAARVPGYVAKRCDGLSDVHEPRNAATSNDCERLGATSMRRDAQGWGEGVPSTAELVPRQRP